jgi:capsular polysaccharide export protein
VLRVEDGFLRSVGLGADLTFPMSWVLDTRGIHYDARIESDLEALLQNGNFEPQLVRRAAKLREEIVAAGLTKYNVGASQWRRPSATGRVVLVVGQVERDASLALGAFGIRTNIGLVRAVRAHVPEAYVVYKPHPDVIAGLRRPGIQEQGARDHCDEILRDVSLSAVLPLVDEVHVMTSLAGFEALLRAKTVYTYGRPFYAGWGLTRDAQPIPRRTRHLTLDELTAGALLLYPRYLSRATGLLVTPEQALEELLQWRGTRAKQEGAIERAIRLPVRRLLRWNEARR